MRKFLIGLTAFVLVLLGFGAYVHWMDTAPIQVPKPTTDAPDVQMPETESDIQSFGDTKLIDAGQTHYFKYDPVTKDIVAEYGFEVLLNPEAESSRWRVRKPYLVFYQSDYQCRIDADLGTFQVESAGDQSIFKDAQLDKNVVIHIIPQSDSDVDETTIYLDDLTFSSERSEFSTDGPITIQSAQIQLEGFGLILIFNTGIGKVEYLQIKDLDFLRLKGFASSSLQSQKEEPAVPAQPSEQPASADRPVETAAAKPTDSMPDVVDAAANLYRCAIRDNVVIQYGNELLVSGADQVDILNIRNNAGPDNADQPDISGNAQPSAADTNTEPAAPKTPLASDTNPSHPSGAEAGSDTQAARDVLVRCDGGMVIQPMEPFDQSQPQPADTSLSFEMSGAPLTINRLLAGPENGSETLAHCGVLSYKPSEDILRLFTNPAQPEILLNTEESNSRIETRGNVFWDRKAQRANIAGPGKVFIGDVKNPSAEPSEIVFKGVMDLLFAGMPDDMSTATIRTINLTGGMDATLRQNGTLKTLADSAVLQFGRENQLAEARLNGDVHFESMEAGQSSSKAAAESAVFHFDNNQIAAADLNGAVHFVSASGQMDSPNARIEFAPDASGSMHPTTIKTDGDSVLQTPSETPEQPPAKFEAKKIDYDMQTGSGLAHGPIRFTFYQLNGDVDGTGGSWVPVTVTADENARFVADADRTIRQIIFNKNVVASRRVQAGGFTQQDEFHGDRMIVDVGKDATGSTAIQRVTFTEGRVYGQSRKMQGDEVVFVVRLTCREMAFDQSTGVILVTGPGEIRLNNSNAKPVDAAGTGNGGVNFQRPCYAVIDGFNTITWNLNDRHLTVNGDEKTMNMAYVPLVDGQVEKYMFVNSRTIDAVYATNAEGKPVIERIYTDKGITYTETNPDKSKILRELVGQTLEYDAVKNVGWLTITGSEAMPAKVNNTRVPAIRYNVNTGQLKTSLSPVPGVIGGMP